MNAICYFGTELIKQVQWFTTIVCQQVLTRTITCALCAGQVKRLSTSQPSVTLRAQEQHTEPFTQLMPPISGPNFHKSL